MRWVIRLILVVVALTAAVPLFRGLTGIAAKRAERVPAAGLAGRAPALAPAAGVPHEPRTVTVYRWRDERGTMHYESRPPAPGVGAEVIEMRDPPVVAANPRAGGGVRTLSSNPLSVYSERGMEAFIDQLDSTLELLEEHRRVRREVEKDL